MKWISAVDIKHWSDTKDCQNLLPELIKRLIYATSSSLKKLRFPSGDMTYLSGWDGVVISKEQIFHIEAGCSLWEMGTDKNPKNKAEDDYNKRIKNSLGYNINESIFVFVTPRVWEGAETWIMEKRALHNEWKDIVVITAIELEEWLSQCPSVSLWLADRIHHVQIKEVETIDSYWERWSVGRRYSLVPEILLGGREEEIASIYDKIHSPSIAIVKSMAKEESLAFVVAAILNAQDCDYLKNKCVIVDDDSVLRQLINEYQNLIFIVNSEKRDHFYATKHGHSVIYITSAADTTMSNDIISLPMIDRESFIDALKKSGLQEEFATELSKETVRNITILRRRLEFDYSMPEWAKPENIQDLIPAILIGRWREKVDGDKEILSLLSEESSDVYLAKLHKWLNCNDSPLVLIDGEWRLLSPYEAFTYAAPYITSMQFSKYKDALQLCTSDIDPDAILKAEATSLLCWGQKQKYSNWLKEGLFQSSILISILSNTTVLATEQKGDIWIDSIFNDIFQNSTFEWWLSYKSFITQMAEAAPNIFIQYVAQDIKKPDSKIEQLFVVNKKVDPLFGLSIHYAEILFALESLAWEKEYLLPISLILAELAQIKNDSNHLNKPLNSLASIYQICYPQTFATVLERNKALKTVVQKYPKQGFELCMKLSEKLNYNVVMSTHSMRWRLFGKYLDKFVKYNDIYVSIGEIIQLMVQSCDESETQICRMIGMSSQNILGEKNREPILDYLNRNYIHFIGNITITETLRHIIYDHKSLPDINWALPETEIVKYEKIMHLIEPAEPNRKYLWMFKKAYLETLELDRYEHDYTKRGKKVLDIRKKALIEIGSIENIIEFANNVEAPSTVGETYACYATDEAFEIVLVALEKEFANKDFAKAFFAKTAYVKGFDFCIESIRALEFKHKNFIFFPLSSIYPDKRIWDFVETLPTSIQRQYWENTQIFSCQNADESIYAISKLNEVYRFNESITLIYEYIENIPTELVMTTFMEFIHHGSYNLAQNILYKVANIISNVDKRKDVDINNLVQIELLFYSVLEHNGKDINIRLIQEVLSNPNTMAELIGLVYLSSDEKEMETELANIKNNPNKEGLIKLSRTILFDLKQCPFVNETGEIDEARLNEYIDALCALGELHHRISHVNRIIGELLANYPENNNYPPESICRIIERLNNIDVNSGFGMRLFNKRGVTLRKTGGMVDHQDSLKYKKYADKIRFSYPITASIFDQLSTEYDNMALKDDNRTKLEGMEY